MNEYETDPQRSPASAEAAQKSQRPVERPRPEHGRLDPPPEPTGAAWAAGADAPVTGPPAGPYPPGPWRVPPAHQAVHPYQSAPGHPAPHQHQAPPHQAAQAHQATHPQQAGGQPDPAGAGQPGPGGYQPGPAYPGPGSGGHGGPVQPVWQPSDPVAPRRPGRSGRILAGGALALVLMAGSGIAGGAVALALNEPASTVTERTFTAAPVISSADLPGIAASVVNSVVSVSTGSGEGSGVVLTADGFVLTNNHVVEGADAVRVTFADGTGATARIVGTDPRTDLAVLRAEGVTDLEPARLGDSDAVRVGDTVLALGSPLGLQGSVTAGIISSLNRAIQAGGQGDPSRGASSISGLMQTDAPINPGNSGGALVNTNGEVIGINTAIATSGQSTGNIGVGFAIPSNKAKVVVEALRRGEKVSHPYLGVMVSASADGTGAVVSGVTEGSPADQVGLRRGDVVTRLGDKVINDSNDLVAAVQAGKVGDQVQLTYTRDGVENTATVTLAET